MRRPVGVEARTLSEVLVGSVGNQTFAKTAVFGCIGTEDQGSRTKDRMVSRKRFRLVEQARQRLLMATERDGRRVSEGKYYRKMHKKWEKQKRSTPIGDPLQRGGSELKNPGRTF